MTAFQDTASELALLRMRVVRGVAGQEAPAREQALLMDLATHRREFAGTALA
jgi:hypothetical protein